MRMFFTACALALLTGCAMSVSEMRTTAPEATFSSEKSEDTVAKCILFAWQNDSLAGVHYDVFMQPRPAGGISLVNQGSREMADVYASSGKTKVEVFSNRGNPGWIMKRRIASVQTCI